MIRISDRFIAATAVLSELSHLFCCVLPTMFSVASLLAGAGMVTALPPAWGHFHDMMHAYELPMIGMSAAILALGWGLQAYSKYIDCHDTGCHHEPCGPKKKRAHVFLIIASGLFLMNVTIYGVFHYAPERGAGAVAAHDHDHAH